MAAVAVLFPLSLLRNLSALRFTAAASFVCILFLAGMVVGDAAKGPRAAPEDVTVARGGIGLFIGIPVTLVSFTFHYNAPRFY
jgi:amino acid permease